MEKETINAQKRQYEKQISEDVKRHEEVLNNTETQLRDERSALEAAKRVVSVGAHETRMREEYANIAAAEAIKAKIEAERAASEVRKQAALDLQRWEQEKSAQTEKLQKELAGASHKIAHLDNQLLLERTVCRKEIEKTEQLQKELEKEKEQLSKAFYSPNSGAEQAYIMAAKTAEQAVEKSVKTAEQAVERTVKTAEQATERSVKTIEQAISAVTGFAQALTGAQNPSNRKERQREKHREKQRTRREEKKAIKKNGVHAESTVSNAVTSESGYESVLETRADFPTNAGRTFPPNMSVSSSFRHSSRPAPTRTLLAATHTAAGGSAGACVGAPPDHRKDIVCSTCEHNPCICKLIETTEKRRAREREKA